ncbi:hypothetical protein BCR42DRAFT_427317 [Absidia repens]|uniref:Uncharacterized protein n=1 Tax=Absidia repens TaxID=90262 RepID=A0A1X2HZM3_9FUNG|nr:hypothetical protein BCR42DRAFT_427317 [Absidia repens]
MMKSIPVMLCIAATMTIASAQSIILDYPGQSQSTRQRVAQCFPLVNAAGQLPRQASGIGAIDCFFYKDRECRVPTTEVLVVPLDRYPKNLSSLPIPPNGSVRCELSYE